MLWKVHRVYLPNKTHLYHDFLLLFFYWWPWYLTFSEKYIIILFFFVLLPFIELDCLCK